MLSSEEYIKGRGAQIDPHNTYHKHSIVREHIEGIDEAAKVIHKTELFYENPKKIINKVDSPDLGLMFSMNPYQGCEHGCIYCYARNSHQYWGYNSGSDFEKKIIVKRNAAMLLEKAFDNKSWTPVPIMLSGNTDCYQPVEKKLQITRRMLQVANKYKNPVSIITKNSLILRDLDILKELNRDSLIQVNISITTLDEALRLKLEPRTSTAIQRLKITSVLSEEKIPVNVMVAPIIPGLNNYEIPEIIKMASEHGAQWAGYTIVRLNGTLQEIFKDWLIKNYEDRAEKVLNQIASCHGGKLNDSRFGIRMKGEGTTAQMIADLFQTARRKYMGEKSKIVLNTSAFKRPEKGQLGIF